MHTFMGNHKVSVQDSGAPRGEKNHWVVELNDVTIHTGFNGAAAQRLHAAVCEGLDRVKVYEPAVTAPPQPPVLLPDPPSHEESYSNNLTEALRELAEQKQLTDKWHQRACKDATERDALRNTLVALAPDLKVMAILYQQQGQSQRAQALMAIRESLGLEE